MRRLIKKGYWPFQPDKMVNKRILIMADRDFKGTPKTLLEAIQNGIDDEGVGEWAVINAGRSKKP